MKLKEEKELQAISEEYQKALQIFHHQHLKKAEEAFAAIIEKYNNSEFFSVLEIQTRAKVYLSIIQAQLNPARVNLKDLDDYIWEGTFQLNAGHVDRALELLDHAEEKKHKNAYLFYLLAIAHFKKEDLDHTFHYLGKCVKEDPHYKVIVYNEPDFEPLQQNPDFLKIVE